MAPLGSPISARLPHVVHLSRSIRRVREKSNALPPTPKKGVHFEIPDEFKVTLKNEPFLLDDYIGKSRVFIFTTKGNLRKLVESATWHSDDTFKIVPKQFKQLYTIHGEVNGKPVPLVYVLSSKRTKNTYVRVLRKLIEWEPELKPTRLMTDFEQAFMNAMNDVFPECDVVGCLFHLKQALFKHISICGVMDLYNDIRSARDFRKLFALTFVPYRDVHTAYNRLLHTEFYVENDKRLKCYLDYVETTWIGVMGRRNQRVEARFDLKLWNHYSSVKNNVARTNNSVEGWHNGFNVKAQASHISLWKFINLL